MNILSLFDGISCGRVALERARIPVTTYYASEVDKHAIKVSESNYPDIIRLGDVTKWQTWVINWASINLVLAGSPCQGFSFAGKQLAFDDPRSQLFFVFVNILNHIKRLNPSVKFLLENVRMKQDFIKVINDCLGVEPILINSALVSAQDRKRLYWCNWEVEQPIDKNILLKDILLPVYSEDDLLSSGQLAWWKKNSTYQEQKKYSQIGNNKDKAITLTARMYANWNGNFIEVTDDILPSEKAQQIILEDVSKRKIGYIGTNHSANRVYNIHGKAVTLRSSSGGGAAKMGQYLFACTTPDRLNKGQNGQRFNQGLKFYTLTAQDKHGVLTNGYIRKLSPIECERLQTLADNYTASISKTQRYKCLGNGWTVDVVAHLLKPLTNPLRQSTMLEVNQIYNLEATELIARLADQSVDALITDPPYSSGGATTTARKRDPKNKYQNSEVKDLYPTFSGDFRDQRSQEKWLIHWLTKAWPKLKDGGVVALFTDWRQLPLTAEALQVAGYTWLGVVVWDKTQAARPQLDRYRNQAEYALIARKLIFSPINEPANFLVWGCKGLLDKERGVGVLPGVFTQYLQPKDKKHMTAKPIQLMRELVKITTPGGLIVDPFAGSGTTLAAAKAEGYQFIGGELLPEYVEIAETQIHNIPAFNAPEELPLFR